MAMTSSRRLGALVAAALGIGTILAGCAGSKTAVTGESAATLADSLLTRLRASYASTPLLSLNGDMKVSGLGITIWFDAVVRAHDSLRVNLVGPFGVPVGGLAATEGAFLFFNVQEGEAVEGVPNRETLGKLMQLGLSYDEMIAMLRGEIPNIPEKGTYGASEHDGVMSYRVNGPGTVETFSIDIEKLAVLEYTRMRIEGDSQTEELALTYKDFLQLGSRRFPQRASVVVAGGERRIMVHVDRVRDDIPDGRSCRIEIPEGIPHRRM